MFVCLFFYVFLFDRQERNKINTQTDTTNEKWMDGKKEERKGESKQERKTERPVEKFVFFRTKPRTGRIK